MLKPVFCSLKIHDTDRNVPEQTPSASFDHANKYFLQKIDFAPHTFPNQIPSDRFQNFQNQAVPDPSGLSHCAANAIFCCKVNRMLYSI
jgi:hypothetical protein